MAKNSTAAPPRHTPTGLDGGKIGLNDSTSSNSGQKGGSKVVVEDGVGSSSTQQSTPNAHNAVDPNAHDSKDDDEPAKPKASFASLFRDNRLPDENCTLKYIPFEDEEFKLTFDEIDTVEDSLGFCLVGCVVGRKVNGYAVKEVIRKWGYKNVKFQIHASGWVTFKFANDIDREKVLDDGPHLVYGRHLFLKKMPRCFLFRVEDMLNLPTWVQVHGLPADCWTNLALSRIASIVGKPIHTDKLTQSKDMSNYARVLVEVDVSKPKIQDFTITLPTGVRVPLHFVYETDPQFCIECNVLGHSWDTCLRNKDRVVVDGSDGGGREDVGGGVGVGERPGARSLSRNARRRWNRRQNRGAHNARGRGLGRGRGGARDVGGDFDEGADGINLNDHVKVNTNIVVNDVVVESGDGVETVIPVTEALADVEEGFVVTPFDGGDKFVVEMFADECEEEGFEEVTSKRTKKAIRYLKRLKKESASGSSSSESTEYVEVDPRTWQPRRNAGTVLMTHAQARARRVRAALHNP